MTNLDTLLVQSLDFSKLLGTFPGYGRLRNLQAELRNDATQRLHHWKDITLLYNDVSTDV